MALNPELLLNILDEPGCFFYGSAETEIYEARLYDAQDQCRAGILYVAEGDGALPASPKTSVLCVPHGQVQRLLDKVQSILVRDYRRSAALSRLHHAVYGAVSYDGNEVASICHGIMENPVCLLDAHCRPIAVSAGRPELFSQAVCDCAAFCTGGAPAMIAADENSSCRRLLGSVLLNGVTMGFILVLEVENKFEESFDVQYVSLLCSILAGRSRSSDSGEGRKLTAESFVLDILQNCLTDQAVIRERMRLLHWPESEKYYLLAVEKKAESEAPALRGALKAILGQEFYAYEGYYVAVIGCKWDYQAEAKDFPELVQFLSSHCLYAGLSYGFFDFSMLSRAFMQGKASISLGKHISKDFCLTRYEDKVISHLLEIAVESGHPMMSFCHPTVIRIQEYDRDHKTEYLKTLAAYILHNLNLQAAADSLFIHRNTMYYRLTNLKELFKVDFNNRRLITKLHLSVLIFAYLGSVYLADIQEPLI